MLTQADERQVTAELRTLDREGRGFDAEAVTASQRDGTEGDGRTHEAIARNAAGSFLQMHDVHDCSDQRDDAFTPAAAAATAFFARVAARG